MRRRRFVAGAVGTLAALGLGPDPSGLVTPPARAVTPPTRAGTPLAPGPGAQGWRPVPAPGSTPPALLRRISALGPSRAWAVGEEEFAGAAGSRPLAMVWDGEGWTKSDLSHLRHTRLHDVAAAGPAAAWSVGEQAEESSPLLRWNGTAWHEVTFPGWAEPGVRLTAVAVGPDRRVWACGSREGAVGLLRRSGGRWRWLDPLPVAGVHLYRVVTRSPGEVWVCGDQSNGGGWSGLVARWDGAWTVLPAVPGLRLGIADVHPEQADCVWAVGTEAGIGGPPGRPGNPSLSRWDGSAWTRVDAGFTLGSLTGIAGDAEGRAAWISGSDFQDQSVCAYLRREGDGWTVVRGPSGTAPTPAVNDVTAVPGTAGFWSAGATARLPAPTAEAYTERLDG
ncbi:hypothetical protein [Streptomyces sp. NPDC048002]|uniref:hypothetical protein n=1 Tax=Streptomyces sp. NPDC048002 TaxID=3154344 RepID=UPI00340AA803